MTLERVVMLSLKQTDILTNIVNGNGLDDAGNFCPVDLDQLLERVAHKPSKDSMHFSIRTLVRRGLIYKGDVEKRRGRKRVTYFPTEEAKNSIGKKENLSIVEPEDLSLPVSSFEISEVLESLEKS
jgi:predicted transcriptional regulator